MSDDLILPEYPEEIFHKKKCFRTPEENKILNRIAQARFRVRYPEREKEKQKKKDSGTIHVVLNAEEKQALKEVASKRFTTVSQLVAGMIRENLLQQNGD